MRRFRFEDLETRKLSLHFLPGALDLTLNTHYAPCAVRHALCALRILRRSLC
jgi:hypothetical protein